MIGMLTITGMAGSYTRMLIKTPRFNELRTEKEAIKSSYKNLEQIAQQNELQAESLSSLAGEVSTLYGLKADPVFEHADPLHASQRQFQALRDTAMSGAAAIGISMDMRDVSTRDWDKLASAPTLWPVVGHINSTFGSRSDPFNGEGAFHRGVDIQAGYGTAIIAPAGGVVRYADFMNGYGRAVVNDHGTAVSIHEVGIADNAACRSDDGGTVAGLNVHTAMEGAFTVERIAARTKRAVDVSDHRPQCRSGSQLVPVTSADVAHVHTDSDGGRAAHGGVPQSLELSLRSMQRVRMFEDGIGLETVERGDL